MPSAISLPPVQYSNSVQPQYAWNHPQPPAVHPYSPPPHSGSELHEKIGDKLGDLISLIDQGEFLGDERELAISIPDSSASDYPEIHIFTRDVKKATAAHELKGSNGKQEKQVNVFSKLDLYMNSRLPAVLQPLRVYMPTYPLLCLAAQYSANAYVSPQSSSERKDFVSADGRLGTKAMVIKSIPCDDKKTIVFAIRGTSMLSIRDWGVNLSTDPVSPKGFLDDEGNLCHSGFLKVAKAMVKPIATRLRTLLEENPSRASCSLLITGHSAGGAVASLLYAHMLSKAVESELNVLTDCFKRVHCVTFGAPPISLLPLQQPESTSRRSRKCLFHSFINEGDPVVRAERAYIKSLVDLLSQSAPSIQKLPATKPSSSKFNLINASMSRLDLSLKPTKQPKQKPSKGEIQPNKMPAGRNKLWWDVPPATLSNAGRLVVLRVPDDKQEKDVTASIVKDEQLRQVIFGDPLVHAMDVYARRIEALAVRAVTGKAGEC